MLKVPSQSRPSHLMGNMYIAVCLMLTSCWPHQSHMVCSLPHVRLMSNDLHKIYLMHGHGVLSRQWTWFSGFHPFPTVQMSQHFRARWSLVWTSIPYFLLFIWPQVVEKSNDFSLPAFEATTIQGYHFLCNLYHSVLPERKTWSCDLAESAWVIMSHTASACQANTKPMLINSPVLYTFLGARHL
jgi:hypothetical protein